MAILTFKAHLYAARKRKAARTRRRRSPKKGHLKSHLSLYSLHYADACNKFAGPISASLLPGYSGSLECISQRWRSVGKSVSDLTGPRFKPQTSRSRHERVTTRPTGQWTRSYIARTRTRMKFSSRGKSRRLPPERNFRRRSRQLLCSTNLHSKLRLLHHKYYTSLHCDTNN